MPDYKILVVDYDPRSVELLRETLEGAGYSVRIAKDGLAAIEAFHRIQPSMVFIEAMLPKKHGFEVCQEIKQSLGGETTPIVIVSSIYKGRKYRAQAFYQHHCDEYLEKPIPPEKLLEVVHRFLPPEGIATEATPQEQAAPELAASAGEAMSGAGAEVEIMERLDELLPDLDGENSNVVAFDPSRGEQPQAEHGSTATATLAAPPATATATDTAPSTLAAEPIRVEDIAPAVSGSRSKLIWVALGVAIIAGIALIFLFVPR